MKKTVWTKTLALLAILSALFIVSSCSVTKNTAMSRFYQGTVTRYNVWFNGHEAFLNAQDAQEKGIKDNLNEPLTMYPFSDLKARQLGSSDYELAIEKAQKSIKLHSISAKPKKKQGTLSESDKRWYNKKEYNPFLWRAWLLLADSQMQKGDFIDAASTYSYICSVYSDEPEIVAEAQYKMAQCYSEEGWLYESDELFQRSSQTKLGLSRQRDYDARKAAHLLRQERFEESIPLLEEAISRKGVSRTQKIRERYLLAQLYKATGRNSEAYSMFSKVIRMSPPYDTEFQARIQQTETLAQGSDINRLLKKLSRMERDPNNKEKTDQIYYAKGNLYLSLQDTVSALGMYETGIEKSTKDSPEKGVLLLTMADLYWERGDYSRAGECYSKAVGMIDSSHKRYQIIKLRSEVLDELSAYTETIELQDSLQRLSLMPDEKVLDIVERIIREFEEQEKLEAEKQLRMEKEAERAERDAERNGTVLQNGSNEWYFYNEQAVLSGRKTFRQKWGERKLEDDWRRSNKTVLADFGLKDETGTASGDDGLLSDSTGTADSSPLVIPETDPHKPEYYIQQIPYSDEEKAESDRLISEALLGAGIVYKDRLTEYEKAQGSFNRIIRQYPDSEEYDDALYNLFLMYSLQDRPVMADSIRNMMSRMKPESPLTLMVCDPDYMDNARYGRHREDSIYAETYSAYLQGDTALIFRNCDISASKYPLGAHRAKFMFIESAVRLQNGDINAFLEGMRNIVNTFPDNEISQLAGLIAQGMQDGKILKSTSFGSIWSRRNDSGADSLRTDTIRPQFVDDRYQPFIFLLAWPEGEADRNQLLFEVARYNFSNYMMRNFDISFMNEQGIEMLKVGDFLNFDEACYYSRSLYSDSSMAGRLEGFKSLVITEENLKLLFSHYSFDEYEEFYKEHYLNIPDFEIDGATLFEEYDGNE
ncbi:MAG: tetratricopeptide repeat protein [Bacteroidaceae bacterium]|nr:tetratricopeptide repeat protein [Bacteroidaceae bacterium]